MTCARKTTKTRRSCGVPAVIERLSTAGCGSSSSASAIPRAPIVARLRPRLDASGARPAIRRKLPAIAALGVNPSSSTAASTPCNCGISRCPRRSRPRPRLHRAARCRRPGARAFPRRSRGAEAALDRLSLDRRRLWRPWRRLGRRDERMPAGLAALAAARRGGGRLAALRRRDRRAGRHHPPRRHLRPRPRAVREDPRAARRGASSSRARSSTASMSTTSRRSSRRHSSARADGIFNGTDDEPAPPQDVLAYAAELLGLPPPPEVAFEEAELTPMARSFYGENKRVRNDRIKRELGVSLAYPTYRERAWPPSVAAESGAKARTPRRSARRSGGGLHARA